MIRKDGTQTEFVTCNGKRITLSSIYKCQDKNLGIYRNKEVQMVSIVNRIKTSCKYLGGETAQCGSCGNEELEEYKDFKEVKSYENISRSTC